MNSIKIHAYLAHQGIASRRKAEELVAQGKVTINGKIALVGQRVEPNIDKILVNQKPVVVEKTNLYLLINKPTGYFSTVQDELGRKNVLDLLPDQIIKEHRLYPVGRLDQDSEGLMLLTNDGDVAYQLTHPKFEIPKTYQVKVEGIPTVKALQHLRRGVKLKEGFTRPAEVILLEKKDNHAWLELTIHEGRNRQVRRMMERVGYLAIELIRIQFGPFSLDQLKHKKYLILTETEIADLKKYLAEQKNLTNL